MEVTTSSPTSLTLWPSWLGSEIGEAVESFEGRGTTVNPFRVSVVAEPTELPGLRSSFRAWLGEADLDFTVVRDLLLAVHEGVAHVIGESEPADVVLVVAVILDGEIVIDVKSVAMWVDPESHGDGRRDGLMLVRVLVDEFGISSDLSGTTLRLRHSIFPALRVAPDPDADPAPDPL